MRTAFPYKLYLVISEEACLGKNMLWVAEQAVTGGVDMIQIREKNATVKDFKVKTLKLKNMLDGYGVPLIVNDNLEVAMECGTAGIHVGNSDLPPVQIKTLWKSCGILGYSIEYEEQLLNPDAQIADYLGISPVFSTMTKTDTVTEWGLPGIEKLRSMTKRPLVAIGNINIGNALAVINAGADCLAVVSAICAAENPAKAAELLRNELEKTIR